MHDAAAGRALVSAAFCKQKPYSNDFFYNTRPYLLQSGIRFNAPPTHIMKSLYKSLVFLLTASCLTNAEDIRVLFIGNSYTAPLKSALPALLKQSPNSAAELQFITRGGFTLQKHLDSEATRDAIRTGNWNYVVLQEQSQTPALGGAHTASFQKSTAELCELISDADATPVLYLTWGRKDGDKRNPELLPDYATMQSKLTEAYTTAAEENDALLAPIGNVWSKVREQDPALGEALYRPDGSHPSAKGTFLVACVFLHTLFDDPLTRVSGSHVEGEELHAIVSATLEAK